MVEELEVGRPDGRVGEGVRALGSSAGVTVVSLAIELILAVICVGSVDDSFESTRCLTSAGGLANLGGDAKVNRLGLGVVSLTVESRE